MTWAIDHPHHGRASRRTAVMTESGDRAIVLPAGATLVGLLAVLVGAWGAICVFVGPKFGYTPTSASSWQWNTNNALLHLLPGAVAVVAGLMVMSSSSSRRRHAAAGGLLGLAALLMLASGVWFVIGPAIWPVFQSSPAFMTGVGAWTSFWHQLGANLGPGLLLAVCAGMALKASIARHAVVPDEPAVAQPTPGDNWWADVAGVAEPESHPESHPESNQ